MFSKQDCVHVTWTGRPTSSRHRKDPHYLFTSPAKPVLVLIRIAEFQPRKGASFVVDVSVARPRRFGCNNHKNSFDMSADKRPDVHTKEDTEGIKWNDFGRQSRFGYHSVAKISTNHFLRDKFG
ncbi:uncharacterized protein LOC116852870 isoform X2 [Odontomachus brunneus]|uniref:uncharacterized protein LOC116852870 isoform X2 n=1 Tax=Odontomachus brunneus TaxID=486640 RepID=UPI0013F211CB|nr:uncharacterized protein LOC116852870 isoform X2 [Odontomachus brunneus]